MSSAWPGLLPVARVTRSDEAGVFSVCGLDGAAPRRAWAETDDGAAASSAVQARPGDVHRLELVPLAPLMGVVETSARQPIAGASVTALTRAGTLPRRATTDAAGRFSVPAGADLERLVVGAPGYASRDLQVRADEQPHRVTLTAPARLELKALWDGAPVAGAAIVLERSRRAVTDAAGWARFEGLAPGASRRVSARKDRLVGAATVAVAEGATTRAAVTLVPGFVVTGSVVDERGRPREGSVVSAHDESVPVGPAGAFELPPLAPGTLTVEADAPDCHGRATQAIDLGADVDVALRLTCEATLAGVVLDAAGAPVADVTVSASCGSDNTSATTAADGDVDVGDVALTPALALIVTVHDARGAPVDGATVSARQQQDSSGCSTAQGRRRLAELSAQKVGVTVRKSGFVTYTKVHELTGAETALDVTLEAAQGSLEGHALGADGRPTPGLQVRYGYQHRAISGADGRFHFDGLAHADEALSVTDATGAGTALRVKVEQAPVSVDVGPAPGGAVIDGRVSGSGPINTGSGFVIAVLGAAPAYRGEELLEPGDALVFMDDVARVAWTPVRQGRFTLSGLPPGRWALYLGGLASAAEDAVRPRATLELSAGERRAVELSP